MTTLRDSPYSHWMIVLWGSYIEYRFIHAPVVGQPLPGLAVFKRRIGSFVRRPADLPHYIQPSRYCRVATRAYGPYHRWGYWTEKDGIIGMTEYEAIQASKSIRQHLQDFDKDPAMEAPEPYPVAIGYRGKVAVKTPWRLFKPPSPSPPICKNCDGWGEFHDGHKCAVCQGRGRTFMVST